MKALEGALDRIHCKRILCAYRLFVPALSECASVALERFLKMSAHEGILHLVLREGFDVLIALLLGRKSLEFHDWCTVPCTIQALR